MNILYISPNSPRESVGGVERYITNLLQYYKDEKDAHICLLLPSSKESCVERIGGVTVFFDHNLYFPGHIHVSSRAITRRAREFSLFVEEIINKYSIDIISTENFIFGPPTAFTLLLTMICSIKKIPLVLRLHSFPITDLQIEILKQLMWSKISCVSQSVTGDCFLKGIDIDNLTTHYLGVNTNEFASNPHNSSDFKGLLHLDKDSKIILTASRVIRGSKNIIKEKGLVNLIRAFSKISSRNMNVYLLIAVGNPPKDLEDEYISAIDMLNGYIKLHGIEDKTIVKAFTLDEMPHVYKSADLFVLPSENETFGQVFIEAMSSGVPVIGTKVGGIPEIIRDSYNGYLVQPDDASLLAQKMEVVLHDETMRNNFIEAGKQIVNEKFSLETQFSEYNEMLNEVVTQYGNS